jgi:hypothetical protein
MPEVEKIEQFGETHFGKKATRHYKSTRGAIAQSILCMGSDERLKEPS